MELREEIAGALDAVREKRVLVHNITNYVVMNSTANALLALGASPVMAHAVEEVEELVSLAGALVINIGTLSSHWIDAMFLAGRRANALGIPVVLDPVGAGATRLRTETSRRLLAEVHPAVLRGNASEILAVGAGEGGARGVDAAHTVEQARQTAIAIARAHGTVVSVTGPEDFVTDGRRAARVRNGHPLMGRVTGTGCASSSITGAFCAVEADALKAAAGALVVFGLAGEIASQGSPRPGTFGIRLLDGLDEVSADLVRQGARIEVQELPA